MTKIFRIGDRVTWLHFGRKRRGMIIALTDRLIVRSDVDGRVREIRLADVITH